VKYTRFIAGAVLSALALFSPMAVLADSTTTLTGTDIGLTSPQNAYGPWTIEDLHSTNKSMGQAVDWNLAFRQDNDHSFAAHGATAGLGYTRDITDRFTVAVDGVLGTGGASPLPNYDGRVAFGYKYSPDRHLALNVADDNAGYTDRVYSNKFLVGPAYANKGLSASVQYVSTADSYVADRAGGLADVALFTNDAKTKIMGSYQFGGLSYETAVPGTMFPGRYYGSVASLSTLQWVKDGVGVTGGVLYSDVANEDIGGPLYHSLGVTLGLALHK
jgi:hypothetical protein